MTQRVSPAKPTYAWAIKKVSGILPRNPLSRYYPRSDSGAEYGKIQHAALFGSKKAAEAMTEPGEIVVKVRVSVEEVG